MLKDIKSKYGDNYFLFSDTIFVYTSIMIKSQLIVFKGYSIEKVTLNKYVAYKDSTVELEVLSIFSLILYLVLIIHPVSSSKIIYRYLNKYRYSALVDTHFDNLNYGTSCGYIDFINFNDINTCNELCVHLINYINTQKTYPKVIKHEMYSFIDKTFAKALYHLI